MKHCIYLYKSKNLNRSIILQLKEAAMCPILRIFIEEEFYFIIYNSHNKLNIHIHTYIHNSG